MSRNRTVSSDGTLRREIITRRVEWFVPAADPDLPLARLPEYPEVARALSEAEWELRASGVEPARQVGKRLDGVRVWSLDEGIMVWIEIEEAQW